MQLFRSSSPQFINRCVSDLLDDTIFVSDKEQIQYDKFMPFALEAFAYASANRKPFAITYGAAINKLAAGVNPGAGFEITHKDLIGEREQITGMHNRTGAKINR